jgi:hypothetical protein
VVPASCECTRRRRQPRNRAPLSPPRWWHYASWGARRRCPRRRTGSVAAAAVQFHTEHVAASATVGSGATSTPCAGRLRVRTRRQAYQLLPPGSFFLCGKDDSRDGSTTSNKRGGIHCCCRPPGGGAPAGRRRRHGQGGAGAWLGSDSYRCVQVLVRGCGSEPRD